METLKSNIPMMAYLKVRFKQSRGERATTEELIAASLDVFNAGLMVYSAGTSQITSTITVGEGEAAVTSSFTRTVETEAVANSLGSGTQYSVAFETELASSSYPGMYRGDHFLEANKSLNATMVSDVRFGTSISDLGITIPRSNAGSILAKSPSGWVWHHSTETGVMQLVPKTQHTIGSSFWTTLHPGGVGGFSIWGK